MTNCTRPGDGPLDDNCGCFDRYGFEGLGRWCHVCRDAYDHWCDEQAARARQEDLASGLGWQWAQLANSEN